MDGYWINSKLIFSDIIRGHTVLSLLVSVCHWSDMICDYVAVAFHADRIVQIYCYVSDVETLSMLMDESPLVFIGSSSYNPSGPVDCERQVDRGYALIA